MVPYDDPSGFDEAAAVTAAAVAAAAPILQAAAPILQAAAQIALRWFGHSCRRLGCRLFFFFFFFFFCLSLSVIIVLCRISSLAPLWWLVSARSPVVNRACFRAAGYDGVYDSIVLHSYNTLAPINSAPLSASPSISWNSVPGRVLSFFLSFCWYWISVAPTCKALVQIFALMFQLNARMDGST